MTNTRRHARLRCGIKGVVTPLLLPSGIDETESSALHESYHVEIENISARGVFLARKPALPVGTFLRIDFDLDERSFHTFGRVVRVSDGGEPSGNGVRLVFVEEGDRTTLVKYLAGQLEER